MPVGSPSIYALRVFQIHPPTAAASATAGLSTQRESPLCNDCHDQGGHSNQTYYDKG